MYERDEYFMQQNTFVIVAVGGTYTYHGDLNS